MKHPVLIFLFIILMASCHSGRENQKDSHSDSVVVKEENKPLQELISKFKPDIQLPFKVDSSFLAKDNFGDSLGSGDIKLLSTYWFKHELIEGIQYDLSEFYKIDSIKSTGTYLQWSEKLDIGMIKYANAYAAGKINLGENFFLLVWVLKVSSYEACPWSSETAVYFTILKHSSIGESFIVGESFGAGDAPVWMTRDIYGIINNDKTLVMTWRQVNDDADATESEVEKRKYTFTFEDGTIRLAGEEKGKSFKVPHPKDLFFSGPVVKRDTN